MADSSSSPAGETVLLSSTRDTCLAASAVGEGTEVAGEGELSGLVVRPVVKIGSPTPRDRLRSGGVWLEGAPVSEVETTPEAGSTSPAHAAGGWPSDIRWAGSAWVMVGERPWHFLKCWFMDAPVVVKNRQRLHTQYLRASTPCLRCRCRQMLFITAVSRALVVNGQSAMGHRECRPGYMTTTRGTAGPGSPGTNGSLSGATSESDN